MTTRTIRMISLKKSEGDRVWGKYFLITMAITTFVWFVCFTYCSLLAMADLLIMSNPIFIIFVILTVILICYIVVGIGIVSTAFLYRWKRVLDDPTGYHIDVQLEDK